MFDLPQFNTLLDLFVWIVNGGGAVLLASAVVVYFLENLAFWHDLPHFVKLAVPVVLAGLIGTVAQLVIAGDLLTYVPIWLQSLILSLLGWWGMQKTYNGVKDSSYARSVKNRSKR